MNFILTARTLSEDLSLVMGEVSDLQERLHGLEILVVFLIGVIVCFITGFAFFCWLND